MGGGGGGGGGGAGSHNLGQSVVSSRDSRGYKKHCRDGVTGGVPVPAF